MRYKSSDNKYKGMKDSSKTQRPAIRLLEKETIELLKATLEEPPVCRMEEMLYLAYLNEDLKRIRPEHIIDLRGISKKEITEILKKNEEDAIRTPCAFMMNGSVYIAQLEKSRKGGIRSLRLLKSVPLFN